MTLRENSPLGWRTVRSIELLICPITADGSYTISTDGPGMEVLVSEPVDKSKVWFDFDFVITEAQPGGWCGSQLVENPHPVQYEPGIAGELIVFGLSRLPD